MKDLLDLVAPETRKRLEQVMEEQSKIVEAAVREAFKNMISASYMQKQVTDIMKDHIQGVTENYVEWRMEDADYDDEMFEPMKRMVTEGINHFMGTDKARKLASEGLKSWIENMFEDDTVYEDVEDELRETATELLREHIKRIRNGENATVNEVVKEHAESIVENQVSNEAEEWEEDEEEEEEEDEEGGW